MGLLIASLIFAAGLGVIYAFTDELVKGLVGTSLGSSITASIISIIFIDLDLVKLVVGVTGSLDGLSGIALGCIIGASMIPSALLFGIAAVISPVRFQSLSKKVLVLPLLSQVLFGLLAMDGSLSRMDGAILLSGFALAILYILRLSKRGLDIRPSGDTASILDKGARLKREESLLLMLVSLLAIVVGSRMLVIGSKIMIAGLNLTDTFFGMTVIALLVSMFEVVRKLPALSKGGQEVSFGAVTGPLLTFFLFNAGIIAAIRPIPVNQQILRFYLPMCMAATMAATIFMLAGKIPRSGGVLLVILYLAFFMGGYILG